MKLKDRCLLILRTADPVTGKLQTQRDIMWKIGVASASVVFEAMNVLEREGDIRRARDANGNVMGGTTYLVDKAWTKVQVVGTIDATGIHLDT